MFDKSDNNLDRIILYFVIGVSLIFFFAIFTNVDAAAIYGPSNCTSTHYRILKRDGTETFGVTSTTYNIEWNAIGFSGTENLDANSYYDLKITFINNINLSYFGETVDLYSTTSLCGSTINQTLNVSSLSVSGKVLTVRLLTSNMVDYWTFFSQFAYTGSQGISTVTLSKVDMTGSSGIIENNNENTNNIINNNNENTQDIIDNQNQNTQDILESQQDINDSLNSTCTNGPNIYNSSEFSFIKGKYLDSTGSQVSNSSYNISKMFLIKPDTQYNLKFNFTASSPSYCFYRSNSMDSTSLIACYSYNNSNNITFTSPTAANYLVISIRSVNNVTITGPICNNWNSEAINDINSFLNDSNVTSDLIDDIVDSDFYHNDALTSIITAPLTLLNSIIDTNNTCQPLELPFQIKIGSFYDKTSSNVTLPCGSILWSHASSTIVNLYRLIVGGFIIFRVCTYAYLVIDSSIDPFKDKLEVIDL